MARDQRRRGRRDPRAVRAREAALTARQDAAQSFFDMDSAQKFVGARLAALSGLDAAAADPLRRRFAAAHAAADEAAGQYIAVVDAHDLDDEDRSMIEYEDAGRAMHGVVPVLARATETLNRLAADLAPLLARAEAALDDLAPLLRTAREALQEAREAVDAAAAAGMDTAEVEAEFELARGGLAELTTEGLGGLGLRGAMLRAGEVAESAGRIAEDARELAEAVARTRNGLASVRTRVQMTEGRRARVEDAMSELRREYALACWQDLRGAPEAMGQALERAGERIAETERAASAGDWRTAPRALAAARAELKDAERRAARVDDRVRDLREVKADPSGPLERARFTVRDAQRLAVSAPGGPAPAHARVLDGLVARLERAPGLLQGAHPDYWAYLSELRAIEERARDVVEVIRQELAG
ncbi:molecular chaperone DnaJ [Actinocorallia sp. A-T 12471]|uniref:molecular chaperone DnaJ n=1 Tax=Actinocorallia sp. A-T 12471 TaxID=3089813 RepID=UPI0029D37FAA|nr:molecular chaperone DnaJ [Actinocorallia sp. A-T 12471]MDX6744702.1 molecular chaperone DnaJ [Actinocorallia sp. A-T 12471]